MMDPLRGADPSFMPFQGIGHLLGSGAEVVVAETVDIDDSIPAAQHVLNSDDEACCETEPDDAAFTDDSMIEVIGQYATLAASWMISGSDAQFRSECEEFVLKATILQSADHKQYKQVKEIVDMFAALKVKACSAEEAQPECEEKGEKRTECEAEEAQPECEEEVENDDHSDESQAIDAEIDMLAREEGLTMLARPTKRLRGKAPQTIG